MFVRLKHVCEDMHNVYGSSHVASQADVEQLCTEAKDGLEIYVLKSEVRKLLTPCKMTEDVPGAGLSSTILTKNKVIATSSTPATSIPTTAYAEGSKESNSSDDIPAELLTGTSLTPASTGVIGLNISVQHQGECTTWKSEQKTSNRKYPDLKVYDSLQEMKRYGLDQQWRAGSFRAKLAFDDPLDTTSQKDLKKAVKKLKEEILVVANTRQGVQKNRFIPYKKEKVNNHHGLVSALLSFLCSPIYSTCELPE